MKSRSLPFALASALFVFAFCTPDRSAAAESPRPNIVVILADDMGFSDIRCYGGEIATPNIDRLASRGLRFTQFYNTSRCCPTRAALLTGLYSHQAGIGGMVNNLGTPAYQGYLNDRCVTIAEALRSAGYSTLMCGKWHVGEKKPHWPLDRGFDRFFGLISGAGNYFKRDPERTWLLGDQPFEAPDENFYITDAITEYAVRFLNESAADRKPFFLYLAYNAPHWPLHAREEDIAKYRGKYTKGWDALRLERHKRELKLGIVDKRWPLAPRDPQVSAWDDAEDKDELDLRMAVYAAQVDRMDQGIGRVMSKLRDLGVEKNTLVLFLSDNGGCHEIIERSEDKSAPTGTRKTYRSYGRGWANAGNTPFRMFKHWVHEGGIATPLIAHWPAVIKRGGKLTHEVGHVIDILPTCLDAAGVEYPKEFQGRSITPVEGKSLVPVFRGGTRRSHDALFWEHEDNRAVRRGKWKLVSAGVRAWELYDLEVDRTELNDLAANHPEKVAELDALYRAWAARVGAVERRELRRNRQ